MKLTGKASGIGLEGGKYTPPKAPPDGRPRAARTWVVVADSRTAFIYQRVANGLELIATAFPDENDIPVKQERGERSFTTGRGIHFAGNPRDRAPHKGHAFIKEVTEWLDRARLEKAFDRLVLVAGPAILGEFHAALPEGLHEMIYQELAKGLTHASPATLQEYL